MEEELAMCIRCGEVKIKGLFTPTELHRKGPRCRMCIRKENEKKYDRVGARPGYGVRGRSY